MYNETPFDSCWTVTFDPVCLVTFQKKRPPPPVLVHEAETELGHTAAMIRPNELMQDLHNILKPTWSERISVTFYKNEHA
jgi:hypothetical protein